MSKLLTEPIYRSTVAIIIALIIGGCRTDLYHGLTEGQANELLLILNRYGISARKNRDSGKNSEWVVSVSESDSGQAFKIIFEYNLPTEVPPGFNELFQKDSFLPTSVQEQARFISALTGELQKTLEKDDSIIKARVHICQGKLERNNRRVSEQKRSAAVFLKTAPQSNESDLLDDNAVRSLIAASISDMSAADVTVIRTEGKKWRLMDSAKTVENTNVTDSELKKVVVAISLGLFVTGIVLIAIAGIVIRKKGQQGS
jgi:type III secretion protein J